MNQDTTPSPSSDIATWFRDTQNAPAAPPPPPPQNKRIRMVLLIGAGLLLAIVGTLRLVTMERTAPCLTAADYTALTGDKADSATLSPTTNFYTSPISFNLSSAAYDDTKNEGTQGTALLKKITDFYTNHPKSSIIITVKGTYSSNDMLTLVEQRIDTVKSSLLAGGVPESSISIPVPEYVTSEDDAEQDISSVLLSITSSEQCT